MSLISFPTRPSGSDRAAQFMQWVWDSIKLLNQLNESQGTTSGRTTRGTFVIPQTGGTGKGASLQFKGQYDPTKSYAVGDIVICETGFTAVAPAGNEIDDGHEAGTFIAQEAVSPGDIHPGLSRIKALATANVDVESGHVTSATVTACGEGYLTAPAVSIAGDGTGATAHAVLTGSQVTAVLIDAAGTGYSSATITIADPPAGANKWADFARGNWERQFFRPRTQARDLQEIIIDAGRDTSVKPIISIKVRRGSVTVGSIVLDTADLNSATSKEVKLRPWSVCVDGVTKTVMLLSSDAW